MSKYQVQVFNRDGKLAMVVGTVSADNETAAKEAAMVAFGFDSLEDALADYSKQNATIVATLVS